MKTLIFSVDMVHAGQTSAVSVPELRKRNLNRETQRPLATFRYSPVSLVAYKDAIRKHYQVLDIPYLSLLFLSWGIPF
jgi:hypothetical protein